MRLSHAETKTILDDHYHLFHREDFIASDPISIPHRFSKKQDIEIASFWTAMLSWGNRTTIINKSVALMDLMDNSPYEFVTEHRPKDRQRFKHWKHRTFQYLDSLYFLEFLQEYYSHSDSLEDAFINADDQLDLAYFHDVFFQLEQAPHRTRKHVATPVRGSRCKRICMFLRWMVRSGPVDFGLWTRIKPRELYCPLDVHVERVARHLGLLKRKQTDWKAVLELSTCLAQYDAEDPIKYDFALFGLGAAGIC